MTTALWFLHEINSSQSLFLPPIKPLGKARSKQIASAQYLFTTVKMLRKVSMAVIYVNEWDIIRTKRKFYVPSK